MTKQHQEFNYYCLDRLQPFENDIKITYNNDYIIRTIIYKIGLKAKIKHQECFILYTDSDLDLEQFIYITTDNYYNNQRKFFNEIFSISEYENIIFKLNNINIFEFVSLLNFLNIYNDFKLLLEENWSLLNMDALIEL